jgi:drug/metabolite transporter (DMT)-like permease
METSCIQEIIITMNKSTLATLGVLFVSFIWGVEFVLVHNAIRIIEPYCFNFIRFGVAGLFIFLCMFCRKDGEPLNSALILRGGTLGGLLFLGFSTQTFGLLYTTVSNSGFITSLNVVLVPLFALFVLGERPHFRVIAATMIAATGLYQLTSAGSSPFNFGDFLTLFAAIMFALHIIFTGKYGAQHKALPLTLVQMLTVAALSLASALIWEDWRRLLDPAVLGDINIIYAIFVASILGTGLAFLLQTLAQDHLSATRVALIFTCEPVFAALAAYLFLNEKLVAAAGVGAGMILLGILLAEFPLNPRKSLIPVVGSDET